LLARGYRRDKCLRVIHLHDVENMPLDLLYQQFNEDAMEFSKKTFKFMTDFATDINIKFPSLFYPYDTSADYFVINNQPVLGQHISLLIHEENCYDNALL
jgi:hypothetical protein